MCLICRPFVLILVLVLSLSADAQLDTRNPYTTSDASNGVPVVTVSAPTTNATPGSTFNVALSASDTTGLEITGFDLALDFDSTVVQYNGCTLVGTIFNSYPFSCNLNPPPNTIDVAVGGTSFVSGSGPIVIFSFTAIGSAWETSPLNFTYFEFNEGDPASVTVNGSITILGTTAASASVAGRLITPDGAGVGRARVRLMSADGHEWTALTNGFGYFKMDGVAVGQTYVLSAMAKQHTFQTVALTVDDDLLDILLISQK